MNLNGLFLKKNRFKSMTVSYIRNAHAVMLVSSVDNPKALADLDAWNEEIDKKSHPICKVLVINKIDIEEKHRQVKIDLEVLKKKYNCQAAFFTSAVTGQNIQELFYYTTDYLMDKQSQIGQTLEDSESHIRLTPNKPKKATCCDVSALTQEKDPHQQIVYMEE